MPSPSVALDIIKAAMRNLGVIATGETPSASEAADGLSALNDVLELWNTQGLSVWQSAVEVFNLVPGQAIYNIGVGAEWNTARPVTLDGIFTRFMGVDYPAQQWTLEEYNATPIKTTQQPYPDRFVYVNDYPVAQVYLWPTPAVVATAHLNTRQQIASVPNTGTVLSYPPGYAAALQWSLAAYLAPQYGLSLTPDQQAMVRSTKAAIMKANRTPSISAIDPALSNGPLVTYWNC